MLVVVSAIVGLVLAVLYEVAWWRIQMGVLSRRKGIAVPLAVGGFVLRLVAVGLVILALWAWTPLNILAVAVAFAVGFSILSFLLLRRLTRARPNRDASIPATSSKE